MKSFFDLLLVVFAIHASAAGKPNIVFVLPTT
jgi:hypothetical protein